MFENDGEIGRQKFISLLVMKHLEEQLTIQTVIKTVLQLRLIWKPKTRKTSWVE